MQVCWSLMWKMWECEIICWATGCHHMGWHLGRCTSKETDQGDRKSARPINSSRCAVRQIPKTPVHVKNPSNRCAHSWFHVALSNEKSLNDTWMHIINNQAFIYLDRCRPLGTSGCGLYIGSFLCKCCCRAWLEEYSHFAVYRPFIEVKGWADHTVGQLYIRFV